MVPFFFGEQRDIFVSFTLAISCVFWIPVFFQGDEGLLAGPTTSYFISIIIILAGCASNLVIGFIFKKDQMRGLNRISLLFLLIGAIDFIFSTAYYAKEGCQSLYSNDKIFYDTCMTGNVLSYLAVTFIVVYLMMLIMAHRLKRPALERIGNSDGARLFLLVAADIFNIIFAATFLVLFGGNIYTSNVKGIWYIIILFNIITLIVCIVTAPVNMASLHGKRRLCGFVWYGVCCLIVLYGSSVYWEIRVNDSDGILYVGKFILVSVNNVWLLNESFLYGYNPSDP
eukprot:828894_1